LNKAGMDIHKILFVTHFRHPGEGRPEDMMQWAERCQTSCKQCNRAFGDAWHNISNTALRSGAPTGSIIHGCFQSIL
jgi:hypothetical protein